MTDDVYWQEVDIAVRSMLGLAVVLAAAGAAALTLTGAARVAKTRVLPPDACQQHLLQMRTVQVLPPALSTRS